MKRRDIVKGLALAPAAGATGLIAAPGVVRAEPQVRWRLASSFPKSLDTLWASAELFARRVATLTDNRFQIQPFAAGELVGGLQVLDAVQAGTIEMGQTLAYYYVGKNRSLAFATTLPFGMNARQQNAWYHDGNGRALLTELFRKFNVAYIPAGNSGAQMGGWYRKPIRSVQDLAGLKMRISGFAGQVMQRLGAVPQQIAAGEIYPALERGTIDAAEWVGPYDDEKLGFVKVAPHYHFPGWWEGQAQVGNLVHLPKFEELPPSYRAALESASAEAYHWMLAAYDARNAAALRRLIAQGAQLQGFPRDVIDAAYAAAQQLYAEVSRDDLEFAKLHKDWDAFRRETAPWFRVSELSYDSMMASRGSQ